MPQWGDPLLFIMKWQASDLWISIRGIHPEFCFLGLSEELDTEQKPVPCDLLPQRLQMHSIYEGLCIVSPHSIDNIIADLIMILWSRHYTKEMEFTGSLLSQVWGDIEQLWIGTKSYLRNWECETSRTVSQGIGWQEDEGGREWRDLYWVLTCGTEADLYVYRFDFLPNIPVLKSSAPTKWNHLLFHSYICQIISSLFLLILPDRISFSFCHNFIYPNYTYPSDGREIPYRSWKYCST